MHVLARWMLGGRSLVLESLESISKPASKHALRAIGYRGQTATLLVSTSKHFSMVRELLFGLITSQVVYIIVDDGFISHRSA